MRLGASALAETAEELRGLAAEAAAGAHTSERAVDGVATLMDEVASAADALSQTSRTLMSQLQEATRVTAAGTRIADESRSAVTDLSNVTAGGRCRRGWQDGAGPVIQKAVPASMGTLTGRRAGVHAAHRENGRKGSRRP